MTTHHAPPVVYPLVRSRLQGQVLLGLCLAGWLLVCVWLQVNGPSGWRQALVTAAIVLASLAAYFGWRNSPLGQLAWDGQVWRWESPGYQRGVAEQMLSVVADFQHVLLVRMENQAHATLWLWVERKTAPERWMDLRRAVYSPLRATGATLASSTRPVDETP